ncbi:MAG: hypothetical protein HUK00_08005 [Bacteroidaceae bacterium]|nr:hypothetical protein [Bacteroidaceae bacterium]
MATASVNLVEIYASMIDSILTPSQKFDLVSHILASLKPSKSRATTKATECEDLFAGFSADWGGDGDALEIANDLRYGHPGSRDIQTW